MLNGDKVLSESGRLWDQVFLSMKVVSEENGAEWGRIPNGSVC